MTSARRAIEVAEQVARGMLPMSALEAARLIADEVREEVKRVEYDEEAWANFTCTRHYCLVAARPYAMCAARQALSVPMRKPDYDRIFRDRGSPYWAVAAVQYLARSKAIERFGGEWEGPA